MSNNVLNVKEMKEILHKGTFNYSIDQIKIRFTKDVAKSSVMGTNIISLVNKENDILTNLSDQDEVEFNIMDPMTNIRPILELVKDDSINIEVSDEKIALKKGRFRSNIHFCDPHIIQEMNRKPKDININHTMQLNDENMESVDKIIKTCIKLRFKKIYFGVEKGILFIETTDRTNKFSNKLKYELEKSGSSDFVMCFDNKLISNLVKVMGSDYESFSFDFSYLEEHEIGRISAKKNDLSEVYYLMSEKENV